MPYCSHCGTVAGETDRFCAKCGAPQPLGAGFASQRSAPAPDPFDSVSPRTACILCYIPVVGWIFAVIVLASQKFRGDQLVRFHSFQGLYLFAVWLFIHWAVRPAFQDLDFAGYKLLEAIMFGLWIFMMIKTSRQERYVLPLIGELAQRSAAEN